MKMIMKSILIFLVLVLVVGGGVFFYLYTQYNKALIAPNSDSTQKITFEVEPGETIESIIANLVDEGLLSEDKQNYFLVYAKLEGIYSEIQAGTFTIPLDLTIEELGDTLQSAGIPEVWITITEGLRADQIADIFAQEFATVDGAVFDRAEFMALVTNQDFISEQGLTTDETVITTLEGFLFPDKYLLANDTTSEQVVLYMLENFKTRIGTRLTYDQLILASLVEKEARTEFDRGLVADIIQRRVDEGWLLGLDVTLLYYHNDWLRVLTAEDLAEDHAYNSRLRTELPPTPICSPGLMSIDAALDPTENNYYYFIATEDDGTMYYGVTQAEHEVNVQQYLR